MDSLLEKQIFADIVGGQPGKEAADLEKLLLQARALIESTVCLHERRQETPPPVARKDGAQLPAALERLIGSARRSVAVSMPHCGAYEREVLRALSRNASRLVVRVLRGTGEADPGMFRPGRPEHRIDVRVCDASLRRVIVVDGTAALVQAPGDTGAPVAEVNDTASVRVLELMFAAAWSHGRRLADHLQLSPRLRTDLTRTILERLRDGNTDETAARKINISLRTYRRHVAEIMRELDANSRFQAGVRAVELGLLAA